MGAEVGAALFDGCSRKRCVWKELNLRLFVAEYVEGCARAQVFTGSELELCCRA